MGFTSPAIPEFRSKWSSVSEVQTTWFNAIMSLFAMFGAFICQPLLKHFMRKTTLCIIAVAAAIFWAVLLATSESRFALGIVIRACLGLTSGAFSSMSTLLLTDVAPKELAGFFGNFNSIGLILGVIWMYLQGNWKSWETLCYSGISASVALALLLWIIPEESLHKKREDPADEPQAIDTKESVLSKKYIGKLLIGMAMMFFKQFCGINALVANLDSNFKEAGVPISSGIASTISVLAQLIACCTSGFLVDKLGRRPLFVISASGCGLWLFLYAINDYFKWADFLPILIIFLYMLSFGLGLGPIPWFVVTHSFPPHLRSAAASVVTCVNWISAFAVIFVYPFLKNAITNRYTLVIFGAISVIGAIFGWFTINEKPKTEKSQKEQLDESSLSETEEKEVV
jgi:MFS family permease